MKSFRLISFLVFCFFFARSQSYRQDEQLITGIQLSKNLPKGFDVSAQYELRTGQNLSEISGSYFSGTIGYNLIKKYLSSEFEYRFVTSPDKDKHRFGFGLVAKYKLKEVTFSNRLAYEREHEYFNSSYENGHEPTNELRNRLQAKWDFKKHWDAYVSCEPFYRISNKEREFTKVRSTVGMNWEFKKHHTLNVYYQFQPDVNQPKPAMLHSLGLMYEWDVAKFKKKKDK